MASEFDIIRRFFTRARVPALGGRGEAARTILGIGDDAAILSAPAGEEIVISTDTLNGGVHFPTGTAPEDVGYKSLAVNLSDLAAMGAVPRWATLAICLPSADEAWISGFASGFFLLAEKAGVELVGGDTTRGPLSINVTILGLVPAGTAILRSGAKAGDDLWVSGDLGAAALGLAFLEGRVELSARQGRLAVDRLNRPTARSELGKRLRGIAHAAIDISDGFAADAGHLLEGSGVGAEVDYGALPLAEVLASEGLPPALVRDCVLSGGDDYELIFCAAPENRERIDALGSPLALRLSRVGRVIAGSPGLRITGSAGAVMEVPRGFDHFVKPG